jgi:hypothetical protein
MEAFNKGVFAGLADTETGQSLWDFLNRPENIVRMETATSLVRPAAEGVEEELLREFGNAVLDDRTKQMIGAMIKQVMQRRGYVIAVQNVKMASGAPFSRATRYKRPDDATFYLFRHPTEPRMFALTKDRSVQPPAVTGKGGNVHQWIFWKSFRGGLRGRIAFGLNDEAAAHTEIAKSGYYVYEMERVLRATG